MKKLGIILAVLCVFNLANAQTSQKDEAERLSIEAVKLFKAGKYKEAVPIAEKVVELREKEFGANHFKTGEALSNLGSIQRANGDNKEAEKTFERAIALYEANPALTVNSRKTLAQMLEIVGFLKFGNNKSEKAAEFYQRALQEHEKIFGQDSPESVNSLWSLANIYQGKRDYKNAEIMYRRVLEIRVKNFGLRNSETSDAKARYECTSAKNENSAEAKKLLETLGFNNPVAKNTDQTSRTPKIIDAGVVNGKAISLAKPAYPLEARSTRASGAVMVQITINEEGKVIFACAFKGNKLLYEASEGAAYQSVFSPTTIAGNPVKVTGVVVYNFVP